jgi:hypothetical protein
MKLFAAAPEGFAELDGGILHVFMRLGRTADEKEMLVPSQALVPILIIQPQAEKSHDATLVLILLFRHRACPRTNLNQGTRLQEYTTRKRGWSIANPA